MKFYSIGEFADAIGVTIQTLRNWDKNGNLKPHHVGKSGYRYYSQEQLQCYLGLKGEFHPTRKTIGYCRVSDEKHRTELTQQAELVRTYMIARGYSFEIITDVGSGMNYCNQGLNRLIDLVVASEVERVVLLTKDRLLRFGYELIENLFGKYGTAIEVIDNTDPATDQELVKDLAQIASELSSRLQGRRSVKAGRILKELLEAATAGSDA